MPVSEGDEGTRPPRLSPLAQIRTVQGLERWGTRWVGEAAQDPFLPQVPVPLTAAFPSPASLSPLVLTIRMPTVCAPQPGLVPGPLFQIP